MSIEIGKTQEYLNLFISLWDRPFHDNEHSIGLHYDTIKSNTEVKERNFRNVEMTL